MALTSAIAHGGDGLGMVLALFLSAFPIPVVISMLLWAAHALYGEHRRMPPVPVTRHLMTSCLAELLTTWLVIFLWGSTELLLWIPLSTVVLITFQVPGALTCAALLLAATRRASSRGPAAPGYSGPVSEGDAIES